MKISILLMLFPLAGFAAKNESVIQCSGYKLEFIVGARLKVNGEFVTSQKNTLLGNSGEVIEMTLMPASDGNNYGFEYVHRPNSETRFLNVQLLQADMDAPPIIGSFPCKKLSG
ncbi:hypothetical protein [Pseudescherichia sp.]|uniref:hypothetical protein n=1 Tax=Pseudescherichia sp. TaxID=2055881 RepID=UPI00289F25DC|nr:hypothetical protein [Pseudescherichia sp.]